MVKIGDIKQLQAIAEAEYTQAIEKIKVFHRNYQIWWMSENKPQGFEMQDIRLGGLIQRLESCRERILAYCRGELHRIEELEELVLSDDIGCSWARIITPAVVSHIF